MKWTSLIFVFIIIWCVVALLVFSTTNPFTASPLQMITVAFLTIMGMILFVFGIIALGYEIADDVRKYFEKQSKRRD